MNKSTENTSRSHSIIKLNRGNCHLLPGEKKVSFQCQYPPKAEATPSQKVFYKHTDYVMLLLYNTVLIAYAQRPALLLQPRSIPPELQRHAHTLLVRQGLGSGECHQVVTHCLSL